MLPHSFLEEPGDWLQQHCFVHKPHQGGHVTLEHVIHQCLIPIGDCLAFEGVVTVLVEHMTATEIHC